jgi:hypothetical protein
MIEDRQGGGVLRRRLRKGRRGLDGGGVHAPIIEPVDEAQVKGA